MDCRVVLAQTKPVLGDLGANLKDHLERAAAAAEAGADLVVFPELSLTGYFLKDQTAGLALARDAEPVRELARASERISIAAGFVERDPSGRLYNALGFFEDGALLAVHRKVHLVSYGMFDESRDFSAGESFRPIESKHGTFGPLICEDLWHVGGAYAYFLREVDALLCASSSPARGVETTSEDTSVDALASARTWDTLLRSLALWFQTWVVYVNRVGFEDGIGFAGGSRVIDPFGAHAGEVGGMDPELVTARLTASALGRARVQTPLRRDEKPWIVLRELERLVHGLEDGEGEESPEPRENGP